MPPSNGPPTSGQQTDRPARFDYDNHTYDDWPEITEIIGRLT